MPLPVNPATQQTQTLSIYAGNATTSGGGTPDTIQTIDSGIFSVIHYDHSGRALGDVFPLSLDFAIYLNRVGYCNYNMDVGHPLCTTENLYPYITDFVLYRGVQPIMGGIHTAVSIDDVEGGMVQVAGLDWSHYLELADWPFNPDDPLVDLYLEADRDIALVVKDILTRIQADPNRLVFDLSTIAAIGHLINYKIEANDSEDIHTKLVNLAKQAPGFDFDISWDKKFNIYTPQKGGQSGIVLEQGNNIYKLAYNNKGPAGTHTLGTAQTASSRAGKIVDSPEASIFRRIDASAEFTEVSSEADLIAMTTTEAARNASPHRELTITVVKDELDIWTAINIGDTVGVLGDTGYEFIDEEMRVVGMQCTPNDEGDEEWLLTVDDGTLSL